jgi:hypothetical protein
MKNFAPILGLAVAFSMNAQGQDVEPSSALNSASRLSLSSSNQCLLLANKDCHGQRQQAKFINSSGYFISIEKFDDRAVTPILNRVYELPRVGNIHAHASWDRQITGELIRFGRGFKPTQNSALNVELSAGKVAANVNLNTGIDATLYPQSLSIPAFSVAGITIPAQNYFFAGLQKNVADYHRSKEAESYFGDFRQSFGTSFRVTDNTHILINQSAKLGLDKINYGAGLGFAFTSEVDRKIGANSSQLCQQGNFYSKARFAFAVSVCSDKVERDLVYDELYQKSAHLAERVNGRIAIGQNAIDRINHVRDGRQYRLPTYKAEDIMGWLGMDSPYGHVKTSFVIAASFTLNGATVSLSRIQPLNKSRDGNANTSITVTFDL